MSEYDRQVEEIREAFEQEFERFADLSLDGMALSDAEALLRDLGELKIRQTGKKAPLSEAKKLRASSDVLRKNSNTDPWKSFAPDFVVTSTVGPARVPYSAE